ncbi:MAG: response regulator [Chloroflexi bacterium]|nr:response regulator [Chloroflexota bacterium]
MDDEWLEEQDQKRVLVVEDNAGLRSTLSELLRWQGYRVDAAAHGAEALVAVSAERPDVIVTDLEMPVMDGATFIQRCRGLPGLDRVPIVVMSAHLDSDRFVERLRAARVSAYLAKPFGVAELTDAIESQPVSTSRYARED